MCHQCDYEKTTGKKWLTNGAESPIYEPVDKVLFMMKKEREEEEMENQYFAIFQSIQRLKSNIFLEKDEAKKASLQKKLDILAQEFSRVSGECQGCFDAMQQENTSNNNNIGEKP